MFDRILLAYDGSPGARRALDAVVALAYGRAAPPDVVVVAVEAHLPHYGATIAEVEEEREVEEKAAQRWLTEASAALAARGLPARIQIRAGHPAQEIVRAAAEHQATIIVIGGSGHSGVWGRFLGGTAEKVSRHAPCSVLIVC